MQSEAELENIKEERAFIHDISSPLMIAMGMLEYVAKKMPVDQLDPKLVEKTAKAQKALDRISALLKDRRTMLITRMTHEEENP